MAQNIYRDKDYLKLLEVLDYEHQKMLANLLHKAVLSGIDSLAEIQKRNKAETR